MMTAPNRGWNRTQRRLDEQPAFLYPAGSPPSLEDGLSLFSRSLAGRNLSPLTARAYATDIQQLVDWIQETDVTITRVDQVQRREAIEYLGSLADLGRSGVTRARKLAAIREFFRFLTDAELIPASPVEGIAMPKKERTSRVYLRPDEYARMLSTAGAHPRDFAILQLFLQTGIRVSELCNLQLPHLDLIAKTVVVIDGKGQKDRAIDLEKKAIGALKNYLAVRPLVLDDHVFLNYEGEGISDRGVKKIVEKYRVAAGIEKQISCNSLRHTFATYKAERGVSAFQLQQWLRHASVTTSQIYVHMGRENSRKVMEATSL